MEELGDTFKKATATFLPLLSTIHLALLRLTLESLFKKATTTFLPLLSTHYVLPRASRAVWRHAVATATGYDFSRAL